MRKIGVNIIVLLAVLCLSISGLYAEEQKVTGSVTSAFLSQYVFRGYELSSGSLVIQPAITLFNVSTLIAV